ncbi:MAG TPA: peptide-methionine (S)-S-oxide reductase MsrA [Burkholderiales bacterium]|jgi:peptide-methionine (S)-S-oxide reductase
MAKTEIATLGAGCFWCVEAVFDDLKGVVSVESGYTGGQTKNPTYEDICNGDTGHAEVVRVTFNPDEVAYADILRVFFTVHDPTALNRQGNDVGTQYRSAIFYDSEEQKKAALEVIDEVEKAGVYPGRLVTEVTPASEFYMAEKYHQEYFANNPNQPYCAFVVAPKVKKFREKFAARLKK